jgi:hypothetical protein
MSTGGVLTAQSTAPTTTGAGVGRQPWWRYRTLVLVAALAVLNAADLVTTRLVLDRGGGEGNPVMRPFVEGVWGAAALKFGCLALIAVLARRCLGSVRVRRGLVGVVAWYAVVVVWNLVALART